MLYFANLFDSSLTDLVTFTKAFGFSPKSHRAQLHVGGKVSSFVYLLLISCGSLPGDTDLYHPGSPFTLWFKRDGTNRTRNTMLGRYLKTEHVRKKTEMHVVFIYNDKHILMKVNQLTSVPSSSLDTDNSKSHVCVYLVSSLFNSVVFSPQL